jgi:hypothetical protein
MSSDVVAVMDVATIYGASRWLEGAHDQYSRHDDEQAFHDFLHDVVLYDKIILCYSRTCEAVKLRNYINRFVGFDLVEERDTTVLGPQHGVMNAISQLLTGLPDERQNTVRTTPVPYVYRCGAHVDTAEMTEVARRWHLDPDLVPAALFLYRGLCYAGFANSMAVREKRSVAYVATPGRISAMEAVMSKPDVAAAKYPRKAYADLVSRLGLPDHGYDFGFLDSFPASSLSALTSAVQETDPRSALESVLRWRELKPAREVRAEWASRIFDYRTSVAVGTGLTQNIINSTIGGPVQQYIHATP